MSKTWSRKLTSIYWDASTSLPDQVILNIRHLQEESMEETLYETSGLQHLWIDYYEEIVTNGILQLREPIRSQAIFSE